LPNNSVRAKLVLSRLLPNVVGLFLVAFGSVILVWVGWLTWHDMTLWGKNISLIFFGSRIGEAISLGIGMKVIYYFLIGLALLFTGAVTFLRKQSRYLHYFGYLANLPKNVPISQNLMKLVRASGKLVVGLILITILGVSLYLSPIRGNTVAVVGVFASLSAVIIAFLAITEIEIITVEGEKASMGKTSLEENHAYKTISDTARFLDFSHTNMYLRKMNEFKVDIYSSENQITLSSHYAPRRAYLVERQPKKRQTRRYAESAHINNDGWE